MINTRHIKRSKCIRVKHYDYTVDCETTRPLPPPPHQLLYHFITNGVFLPGRH